MSQPAVGDPGAGVASFSVTETMLWFALTQMSNVSCLKHLNNIFGHFYLKQTGSTNLLVFVTSFMRLYMSELNNVINFHFVSAKKCGATPEPFHNTK